jgi:hypothetical protein
VCGIAGCAQVSGRAIFPGAAYLEAAVAAGQLLLTDHSSSGGGHGEHQLALSGLTIATPLVLPAAPGAQAVALRCLVDGATGMVSVQSAGAAARPQLHVTCMAAAVRAQHPQQATQQQRRQAQRMAALLRRLQLITGLPAAAAAAGASASVGADACNDGTTLGVGQYDSMLQLGQVRRG